MAFGMTETAAPDLFLIALAALELLADTAARSPLLLVVEDVQWLDRPTDDVLAFLARRLEAEPITLLVAIGEDAGLPELRLAGLDAAAAGALLDAHAPRLRRRSPSGCWRRRPKSPGPGRVASRPGRRPARQPGAAAGPAATHRPPGAGLRGTSGGAARHDPHAGC